MTRLLLHACCAPCSLEPVRLLCEEGFEPKICWTNPNIQPVEEHDRRLTELRRWCAVEGIPLIEGNVHSSDVFYRQPSDAKPTYWEKLRDEQGCLCVEMESFALFANAQVLGKQAACLLTISDSFVSPELTTAEQRQKSFTDMMKVALGADY